MTLSDKKTFDDITAKSDSDALRNRFVSEVAKDPIYAISWAEETIIHLEEQRLHQAVLDRCQSISEERGPGEDEGDKCPECTGDGCFDCGGLGLVFSEGSGLWTHINEARQWVVDWVTKELVNNNFDGASTSHFFNAVDAAKREAASRFIRRYS